MMATSDSGYSLRQVEKLVGLSRRFIETLVREDILHPGSAAANEWRFSLRDMVVLRTAKGLREARIPHRKVVQALRTVQASLADDAHLASVRLRASGRAIEASDAGMRRDALSGQLLLPLEDGADPQPLDDVASLQPLDDGADLQPLNDGTDLQPPSQRDPPADDAHTLAWRHFQQALQLEATDAASAEAAYRDAIAHNPCLDVAYVNLGAMLCETHRCREAVALYERALDHCGDTPLIHFNRATALEDTGDLTAAVQAYERALVLDPGLADAHFNLGVLMERLGQTQASLRHLNAYRRLHPAEDS